MRRRPRGVGLALALALALGFGSAACWKVKPETAPPQEFLERNYVFRPQGDETLLFEAQIATHIFLRDALPDAFNRLSTDKARDHTWGLRSFVTPMFRVRQLNDSSAAVRTPSFMPRVSLEQLLVHRLGSVSGQEHMPSFPLALLSGLRLTLAHHSNGQAGCFREGFEPVDARANSCRPIAGADTTTVRLNRANGDFSSTFVNVMLHSTVMNRGPAKVATWTVGAAVGADLHLRGLFGELSEEQRELYGSWRLRGQIEGSRRWGTGCLDREGWHGWAGLGCALRGKSRMSLEGELAPDKPGNLGERITPEVERWRGSVEFSHTFDALLRTGPFVRWHDGQDYYNIGFVHRRRYFAVGLMLDLSGDYCICLKPQ